jgi:hypothetical protein
VPGLASASIVMFKGSRVIYSQSLNETMKPAPLSPPL